MSTCVLPGKPHQAAAGLLICQFHLDQVGSWLIDVEEEADDLDAQPSMAISWDFGSHSLAHERAPALLNAIVATDRRYNREPDHPAGLDREATLSAYETLHRFAQRVRTERLLTIPMVEWDDVVPGTDLPWHRSRPERLTVKTERALLSLHLERWIAFQPWIRELYSELGHLRDQLKTVNGTSDPKPLHGLCPRFDDDGSECLGRLWSVKPMHTSGTFIVTEIEAVHAVQCERNHTHTWEGVDLVRLSLILKEDA